MFKKLSALILVILVLLGESACSGSGDKNKKFTVPSYTTRDITEELGLKYVGGIKMNSKDQLVIYDNNGGSNRYITVDSDGNIINEIKCDFKGDGGIFALDADDNLYVLLQDIVMEENGYRIKENTRRLVAYDAGGEKLKSVEMGKVVRQKDEDIYVRSISIDSEGNIYLVKNNEPVEIVDKDGKALESSISGVYGFLGIDEKGNVIAGITNSDAVKPFIACIDPDSGKETWKKQLDVGVYIYTVCYNKAEKCTYALTDKGVDRYDSNGNLSGTVLNFMKYNLLKDESYINNMCADMSGNLYILIYDREGARIKKFEAGDASEQGGKTSAGQETPEEKKVVTLAAHYSDRWLEMAVSEFQAGHPDIEIDIKDFKGAYFGESDTIEEMRKRQEQFETTVNTELMAGKGPDIIYFADLPYRKYIDKNMFVNLGELMENDREFNKAELNFNVIDAMRYKSGLYIVPINYQFDIVCANKEILDKENITIDDRNWTWDDFMNIAEKVTKDTSNNGAAGQYAGYTLTRTNRGIFNNLFNCNKFVDMENRKANFATDDFINMLKACKAFNDEGKLYKAGSFNEAVEMSKRGGIAFIFSGISDYYSSKYVRSNWFPGEVRLLRMPSDSAVDAGEIEFGSVNMFAINSNTRYKDEAWEFLKVLLSSDLQASPELSNGLPVNNEALKEKAGFVKEYLQMEQKDIDEINKFISEVGRYNYNDARIESIINAEVDEFFSGNKSAEETAEIIQNKVGLYLNE